MIHFDVWIVLPDGGTALAGEIVRGDADNAGMFQSEVEYANLRRSERCVVYRTEALWRAVSADRAVPQSAR